MYGLYLIFLRHESKGAYRLCCIQFCTSTYSKHWRKIINVDATVVPKQNIFSYTLNLEEWGSCLSSSHDRALYPQISINYIDKALPASACGLSLISKVMTSIWSTHQLYRNAKMFNLSFVVQMSKEFSTKFLFWTNRCCHFMYPLVAPAAQYIPPISSFIYLLYEISVSIPNNYRDLAVKLIS